MAAETAPDVTELDRRKLKRAQGGLTGWVSRQQWMEPVGDFVQGVVGGFYGLLGRPGRALKDLMHGVWPLGHPLHPALTDVPVGAWTVAVIADYAAVAWRLVPPVVGDVALLIGIAGALAAAATGYTDFHETYGQERRVGLLHGLLMTAVILLMAVSLIIRFADPAARPGAIALSTVGFAIALFGAYLGGDLTFGFGTMVNRHAFSTPVDEWTTVGPSSDFPEGEMKLVDASGTAVMIARREGVVYAIDNTCAHAGGPLNEGSLDANIVTCPWHGSRFCIIDGSVRGGPATFAQPAYLVREIEGKVRVKPAAPGH